MKLCPNATLINKLSGTRAYQLPKGSVQLDKIFLEMERNKERLQITDWALTNTTLEEVTKILPVLVTNEVFLRIMAERTKSSGKSE